MATRTTPAEWENFRRVLAAEIEASGGTCPGLFDGDFVEDIRRLCRDSKVLDTANERECSDSSLWEGSGAEERQARLEARVKGAERRVSQIGAKYGVSFAFGGDPRGFSVRLLTPHTGAYNSWGGAECGYGVPTGNG